MASLREEARWVLDDARNGIAWIAVWKTGRSWHCVPFYATEYVERNRLTGAEAHFEIDADDLAELRKILAEDPEAILVNGYYRNIGSLEDMTLDSLVDGLRWQYGKGGNLAEIVA